MPGRVPLIRFHQVDDMADAGIDEGGEFGGSFLGVFRARIETSKEFAWNDPVGAGEGDWWSGHGGASWRLICIVGGTISQASDRCGHSY